ncbi:MAG TPA: MOSC domain-containing protein [Gemmatimonadales bacterium]|nr:MOSC domain-containing protein [Gemmatimonadales bacterium]
MRTIGTVARLQIQRGSLKKGEKPTRLYDPTPLLSVPALNVTPDGALGASPDEEGTWIVDVHHRGHPDTKNEDGLHGISLGFTSHYAAMRQHFGDRVEVGCAGENIIATSDRRFTYEELASGGGVAILAPDGQERVRLRVLQVAHPCRPFTGWALGKMVEPEELKKHLQFLDGGMRGFYCVGEGTGTVSLGDSIAIL